MSKVKSFLTATKFLSLMVLYFRIFFLLFVGQCYGLNVWGPPLHSYSEAPNLQCDGI